ncbi:MAG TPA: DMT family transporter [Steroidobacteraceae bacterium]|nr:DMT family transporter [Steroidobacteraceae bacterium]
MPSGVVRSRFRGWPCGPGSPRAASRPRRGWDWRLLWAGLFFAGDLGCWHESLMRTSITAATLEANLAPMVVTLAAWVLWRERPSGSFLLALALAAGGLLLIVGRRLHGAQHALSGDLLGLATAVFYAGYVMVVARLRAAGVGAGELMLWSTCIFTLMLLPLALQEPFWPRTAYGWSLLLALALISQLLGQGLVAYALAHLPAALGSVVLYTQPVAAALYAWVLLGERLSAAQTAGCCVVLGAIVLARAAPRRAPLTVRAAR